MENTSTPISQDEILQKLLLIALYTQVQNETIILNQTLLDYKLTSIISHLGIELSDSYNIKDTEFYKASNQITDVNYAAYLEAFKENKG